MSNVDSINDDVKVPRWYLAYFFLATFDIFAVAAGLWLIALISGIFVESVEINKVWANRAASIAELRTLVGHVNAPGNDVFDSFDEDRESERMHRAITLFDQKIDEIHREYSTNLSEEMSESLLDDLLNIRITQDKMIAEAEQIFGFFAANEPSLAGQRMATMDRSYASVLKALSETEAQIRDVQQEIFTTQLAEAKSIRRYEILLSVVVLLMVVGATLYGHKIYQSMHASARERKKLEDRLRYQANYDALTGLVNRLEFERQAEEIIQSALNEKAQHALCFLDLDQFKIVNDTCGHFAGDELLGQLGSVLQGVVRRDDTLARLGGDEFGVLIANCNLGEAKEVAETIRKAIEDFQFYWEGRSFRLGVSIGLVPITSSTPNLSELLIQADSACYMAKDLGRNRVQVYFPDDTQLRTRHGEMQWVSGINQAFEDDRFRLYAQPIEHLKKRQDNHYELLLRMLGENGEIIPPGAFLPAAERFELMDKIDSWVISKTFKTMADNPALVKHVDCISLNLSGQSIAKANILQLIIDQLGSTKIDPKKICFEITETSAITNLRAATAFISKLKKLGCRFALDDFGSGLSSFGYLKNFPVDYLKIDGIFVKDMVEDSIDRAMVKSINSIGQVMGIKTIAEFVENEEIKGMLREIGVDYAQGNCISEPQPIECIFERYMTNIDERREA